MLTQVGGPHREGEEPKPMMHGLEKSDSAVVAMKPANNAGKPAAEWVEGAADKAVDLEGCESPYRQLPGFGR